MPPRITPVGLRDLLFWSLAYVPIAAALQQPSQYRHAYPSPPGDDSLSEAAVSAESRWRASASDSLHAPLSGAHDFSDAHVDEAHTLHNERALATLSPAESNPAVRELPAPRPSAQTSAGLSSRQPARSLQDWQVEEIVLLATVDGKIHARDRTTGAYKWSLGLDKPMVETIYHRHRKSVDENGIEQDDPLWIVEPSQDGSIYVYAPGSGFGLQKLNLTVKQLADQAPYASDGEPAVAYTAEKKTTLYTVDAGTGIVLKKFSSAGSMINANEDSCPPSNPLAPPSEEECERIGILDLGQTEYTIGIQDRTTGEQISTIRYFEWSTNNRDQDLRSKYVRTKDNKYIYPKYNGFIYGFDFNANDYRSMQQRDIKPTYRERLPSPVARVYDIVRPIEDPSGNAPLVVLPQPLGPPLNGYSDLGDDRYVFINCTESGSWYALSESSYPTVTDGAATAKCYLDDVFSVPSLPMPKRISEKFVGVHQLSEQSHRPHQVLIDGPDLPALDPPPTIHDTMDLVDSTKPGWKQSSSLLGILIAFLLLLTVSGGLYYKPRIHFTTERDTPKAVPIPAIDTTAIPEAVTKDEDLPSTPMVRDGEPAEETIFPQIDEKMEQPIDSKVNTPEPAELEIVPPNELAADADEDAKDSKESKNANGKHKRGKRGGRKVKEKEQEKAEARARKTSQAVRLPEVVEIVEAVQAAEVPRPAEVISVAASESLQVAGALQINSLIIHTDRVIGQGSCGTSVFEGSFEGRDVAVKRMLSQYYELASQEVSFLQQSDDHPNVVRYFCQQRDDHFLYIAVELCQASLFEVWEPEKARTEARFEQLSALKLSIQQDVPRTLQQLAAGLYHLHNLRIIHRDIKPQNILVAFPKRNQNNGPRLVISDFGLGKNLPENVSTLVDPTGNAGTSGWKAPELISQPRDTDSRHSQNNSHTGHSEIANGPASGVKRAADIFSLGCLFFWVLTDGIHPYEDENGWQQLRELNIKRDNKKMDVLERWSDAYEPMQLITSMLEHRPEHRPTALQVLNHPFFWPAEKRLAFLCDVSDHFEREPRGTYDDYYEGDSASLRLLEDHAAEVIRGVDPSAAAGAAGPDDFLARLDRHFVDTLGKQRKYSGHRLLDLLRALRNKKNHYEDMPPEVQRRVGPLPAGYLAYWARRFPRLLMACHDAVLDAGLQTSDRFRGYFEHGVSAGR